MTVLGTVKDGVVVLDPSPGQQVPPEGTRVVVSLAGPHAWMLKFAGTVDLPSDYAAQHDHYIHGTPKRPTPTAEDWEPDQEGIAILKEIVARSRSCSSDSGSTRPSTEVVE